MSNTSTPRIGFLGLGALGTLIAWHNRALQPLALPRQPQSITPRRLIDRDGVAHDFDLPSWDGTDLDWLIVTTKAGDTLTALTPWQAQLPAVKRIVLLQNGMGQHEQCASWLQQQKSACELWAAISTEGAYRSSSGDRPEVVYAGSGSTLLGKLHPQDTIEPAVVPLPAGFSLCDDIQQPMREKLAINAVINPLTGLYLCPNGELLQQPEYRQHLLQLAGEVDAFFAHQQWPLAAPLTERAVAVATATAANRSSTLQDILAGRPTELAWICGYLLQCADEAGYSLPITAKLYQQLQTDSVR